MANMAAYLAVLFIELLVGANAGELLTADKCPDDPTIPCILFPPAKDQRYNYIDAIIVTYTSPWAGGVNLSLNCWPSKHHADPSTEFVQLVDDDLFCSKCAGNGTYKFQNLDVALNGSITYPTHCWFALGPFEAEDLLDSPDSTIAASGAMTTVITGGNFTLVRNKRLPERTRALRSPVWTGLSGGVQLGIIAGLSLILLGSLGATILISVKYGRSLEDPLNPAYQGLFVAERDGSVSYRAPVPDSRASDAGWARASQAKELLEVGGSSSHPLLGGSGERRY
ncbi:hypothetical protein PV04_07698 [Phialophora macrospora]|uniref:Autophagy-related protein 27 n=1 Tax=Phialophora macrospora TaxID=1851006 RepID=A0A0D2DTJ7_9EURO|nr:hypothetical protein PV04_07698 [Phialophora macrospora]